MQTALEQLQLHGNNNNYCNKSNYNANKNLTMKE
jgi:hypothetical protein